MNVLQIIPELNVGGVETGTIDFARYLVNAGHKAVVVSAGGELVKRLESCGAIHYRLPVHKKSIFTMLKTIPRLVEIIKREQIDIVHARSRVPAWIAYFASRRTRKVFITTCHGYYKQHPFSYVMGWAKRVIVLSNVIARRMIEGFGVPYERIKFIARSVDLEKFKYISPDTKRKEEFNVGIVGRITPIKGHLDFVKAMAKAARLIPRLKVWIVGDAPASKAAYKEQLQILVRRLGLWPSTEFLGTQRDIPAILSHLDLLVLATTTQEAFGRVIIEAQAAGVPVVATKVGGVIDVIDDGKTGLLVAASDPATMAEAVVKIYKDPGLSKKLAENAYKKLKTNYTIELMAERTIDVYKEALSNFKILLIKISSVGDVILSTAAIKAVREKFGPHYKISLLVGEAAKDVLLRCPYIDELLVCDFKNRDKGIRGFLGLARILRKKNFDITLDLQNNRRSHLLSFLSLAPDRYGYANKKCSLLLNHRIKDSKAPQEPLMHQFKILNMLGIELKEASLELWPSEEDQREMDEFLGSQWLSRETKLMALAMREAKPLPYRLIGINISASLRWRTKNWPLDYTAKLCDDLSLRQLRVVITGTEKDLPQANLLINNVKAVKPINACGKTTVNQLACLIKKCSVYISPDSAPLHIAAAVKTPFVALFGPTDPKRHLPPAKKFIVIKKDLTCSPCYKSKCKNKECMELIMPQEVLEAVEQLLK